MLIFEHTGRFFFEKNRFWLFFCLLLFPFVFSWILLSPRFYSLCEEERAFETTFPLAQRALKKRAGKDLFLRRYSHIEPYFIDRYLESFLLLQNEKKECEMMKQHPACSNREAAKRRLEWLQGPDNKMVFVEENLRSSKKIKETEERLMHPVEIDRDDLEHLLSLIEAVPVGACRPIATSPQLIIQDFRLTRKSPAAFSLNLSLIMREWIDAYEKK
jgi:hypothetical protein